MRIVSEFHDFYDCMQANDADKQTVWIRKPTTVNYTAKTYPLPCLMRSMGMGSEPAIQQIIIGFCGKIYPWLLVRQDYYRKHKTAAYCAETQTICRTDHDIDAFVRANYEEGAADVYFNPKRYWKRSGYLLMRRQRNIETFFEECKARQSAFLPLFEQHQTPVFVGRYGGVYSEDPRIEFNAVLRPLQFYRAFPPPQAYQDVVSFMSNLALPMKPIPKLDDKTMAEVKGFNKFSFRKDPIRKRP